MVLECLKSMIHLLKDLWRFVSLPLIIDEMPKWMQIMQLSGCQVSHQALRLLCPTNIFPLGLSTRLPKIGLIVSLLSNQSLLKESHHSYMFSSSLSDKVTSIHFSNCCQCLSQGIRPYNLFATRLNCGRPHLHLLIKIILLIREPNSWNFPIPSFCFSTEARRICCEYQWSTFDSSCPATALHSAVTGNYFWVLGLPDMIENNNWSLAMRLTRVHPFCHSRAPSIQEMKGCVCVCVCVCSSQWELKGVLAECACCLRELHSKKHMRDQFVLYGLTYWSRNTNQCRQEEGMH